MSVIDSISTWSAKITKWLLFGMVGILVFEVISRGFFNAPTIWGYETAGFVFAAYCMGAGAYTQVCKKHTRMDFLFEHLSTRGRAVVDTVTFILVMAFLIIFLWISFKYAIHSCSIREYSNTSWGPPLYPVKIILVLGVAILLLQVIADYIRTARYAITGKHRFNVSPDQTKAIQEEIKTLVQEAK